MIEKCNDKGKVKYVLLAKKGMATKAMINNVATGNNQRLQKQINKGTVQILKP